MDNGGGSNLLNIKMANLAFNDSNNIINNNTTNTNASDDGLFQVMKAVEAAETTINQQVEENNRLRFELQEKIQELEKYELGHLKAQGPLVAKQLDDHVHAPQRAHQNVSDFGNQTDAVKILNHVNEHQLTGSVVPLRSLMLNDEHHALQTHAGIPTEDNRVNGALRLLPGGQSASDNSGLYQLSSPLLIPAAIRFQVEGESDRQLSLFGGGLMPLAEVNRNSLKQDLGLKIEEHREEIMQLKKHLADYSIKEEQIRNEKYVLEKRIAYMRMAFDQQQQDLVDSSSKAISYRQDIIEENIRLTYALQAAQLERSTFVSSLMPLLTDYSLQPPVADAQSIVSNVKILFRHFNEKLLLTEAKLKKSHYQITPWPSDVNSADVTQSPSPTTGMKDGPERVPQPPYPDGNLPISPDSKETPDLDILGQPQSGPSVGVSNTSGQDDLWKYSPIASRNNAVQDVLTQLTVNQSDPHPARSNEETISKQVTFLDLISNRDIDSDKERHQNNTEPSVTWAPKSFPYTKTAEEPSSSYSPYLAEVLEEPYSSLSEDDDPLPGIEGLQISGEALPGRELQVCGYSTNGTTSCNFEWVRHLEDGSFNYIDGAKQPNYLVTADDVDTYLAIEVQPLDNRKRKGELVKVFTNEHRKIICDPDMHSCVEKTLHSGHAKYEVSLSMGYADMWKPATLSIKKDGYSIKSSGTSGVVVSEKYSSSTSVSIPFGSPTEFSILDSRGIERLLRVVNSPTDISCCRDTIVLTLRLFILRANAKKKKAKKRGLFFTK